MEKLSLYERLLKNKNRLKVQAVSLVLAATAVITTGCGKTNTDTPDVPKPGFEDVIDNNNKVEETMTQLTVENLDSEAEKLTNEFIEKGFDTDFDSVRSVLLHLNKDSFTPEEYYSLFDASQYSEDPINSFFKEAGFHNDDMVFYNDLDKLINLKDFCRSADGYKVIAQLEDYSFEIAKLICSGSKDIDGKINSDLKPIFGLLDDGEKIQVGDETFFLNDLDDVTKTLIMYSCTNMYNYIINIPDQTLLSDETKQLSDDIMKFIPIVCCDSYNNIYNSIYNNEFSKQK